MTRINEFVYGLLVIDCLWISHFIFLLIKNLRSMAAARLTQRALAGVPYNYRPTTLYSSFVLCELCEDIVSQNK